MHYNFAVVAGGIITTIVSAASLTPPNLPQRPAQCNAPQLTDEQRNIHWQFAQTSNAQLKSFSTKRNIVIDTYVHVVATSNSSQDYYLTVCNDSLCFML